MTRREMYGNEELVGTAIRGLRDRVFLVTKVLPGNASRTGTKAACERSLNKLRTDYVDLFLLHWSGPHPIEDTVASMIELQQEGKIKAWGVSNMDVPEMERFYAVPGGVSCAANQILYNLAHRGVEYDPAAVVPGAPHSRDGLFACRMKGGCPHPGSDGDCAEA